PHLYEDAFVAAGACLHATSRLHVGSTVTNTVSRHWSVLGATARTFDELAPGRFFVGIATGDGAVYAVGLKPASWAKVERDVTNMRTIVPAPLEIHVA